MHLIHRPVSAASGRPPSEQIVLPAERRLFLKRRWRGVAGDGTEFGFDLGERLHSGAVFFQTEVVDYVIVQIPEVVFVIRPATPDEAALIGWRIGNLHMPVEITRGAVRAVCDPAVRQVLEREGWAFAEETVLFKPLRVMAHAP